MKIVWSKTAEKQLAKIDPRFRKRIESKLAGLDDNASPVADIKKLSSPENHHRLRVGDYRVIYTLENPQSDTCYVVSVKRRTTTTYLHEEHMDYDCAVN
ncbi:type II toxin-antitoxin system RelE family toxin [Leclercia sp. AS011]|uniref:type II toxin-antitoxin system RelE family toxin n=1 Tax=Leclercia sp. AS011 TaxID=3081257 RepID=UPI003018900A